MFRRFRGLALIRAARASPSIPGICMSRRAARYGARLAGRPSHLGEGRGRVRRLGDRAAPGPEEHRCEEAVGPVVVDDEDPCIGRVEGRRGGRFRFLSSLEGDGEPEGRPPALLAFHADPPSHKLDELLRDREAEARAAVLSRRGAVALGERREERLESVPRRCRCPCRGLRSGASALSPSAAGEGDPDGDLAPLGELDGVAHEIREDLPQRPGSPRREGGTSASTRQASSMPFSCALGARSSTASSTVVGRSKSRISSSSLRASIFEKSRMSLMSDRRASPLFRTISAYSRCSAVRSVSRRSPVMPITPFIGVRISWLMFARNSLFARLAPSAARAISPALAVASSSCWLARRIAASASLRSVMSRRRPATPEKRPWSSRRSWAPTETWRIVPSFLLRSHLVVLYVLLLHQEGHEVLPVPRIHVDVGDGPSHKLLGLPSRQTVGTRGRGPAGCLWRRSGSRGLRGIRRWSCTLPRSP